MFFDTCSPYSLHIFNLVKEQTKNLLFGDVWVCGVLYLLDQCFWFLKTIYYSYCKLVKFKIILKFIMQVN